MDDVHRNKDFDANFMVMLETIGEEFGARGNAKAEAEAEETKLTVLTALTVLKASRERFLKYSYSLMIHAELKQAVVE